MTVQDLKAQLAAVAYPQFTESNVLSVSISDSRLVCETDQSELTEQLKEHAQTIAELEKELKQAEERQDAAEIRAREAEAALAEKENGRTVLDFKREADEAEKARQLFRDGMVEAQRELAAMRKRKGVHAGLFSQSDAVLKFICRSIDAHPADMLGSRDAARVLWQNINAKR